MGEVSIDAVLDPGRQVVNFLHGAATRAPLSPAPSTRVIKDARAKSCVAAPAQEFTLPRRKPYPGPLDVVA